MRPIPGGYNNTFLRLCDVTSWLLTIPWSQFGSLCLSSICFTTHDSKSGLFVSLRYGLAFPLLMILTVLFTPVAFLGFLIRIIIGLICPRQPFIYSCAEDAGLEFKKDIPENITFLTANVIMCPEVFVRFNNNRNLYWRGFETPRRLLRQNSKLNLKKNICSTYPQKEDIVIDEIPNVDVMILQEVCERIQGWNLSRSLSSKYPYCIYDVTTHKFSDNGCLMGSGLFICSRFPILEVDFRPYKIRTSYAKWMCYGALMVKLSIRKQYVNGVEKNAVGYVTNIHTQAYQGKEQIIVKQLSDAQEFSDNFIRETFDTEKEIVMFAVMGGDFNADNMSPGDSDFQNHSIWSKYEDVCMKSPGFDYPWSIGTELRQQQIHQLQAQDPCLFRQILLNDTTRRSYILDADVKEQTLELMTVSPTANENGEIPVIPCGGRRRIDRIVLRKNKYKNRKLNNPISNFNDMEDEDDWENMARVTSAWFSSALAGLSDHIPYILQLEFAPCI